MRHSRHSLTYIINSIYYKTLIETTIQFFQNILQLIFIQKKNKIKMIIKNLEFQNGIECFLSLQSFFFLLKTYSHNILLINLNDFIVLTLYFKKNKSVY